MILIHQKLKSHKQELVTSGPCSAPTSPKRWGLLNSWALPGASHPQLLSAAWCLKPIMEGTFLKGRKCYRKGSGCGATPCASGETWGLGVEERPPYSGPVSLLSHRGGDSYWPVMMWGEVTHRKPSIWHTVGTLSVQVVLCRRLIVGL